LAARARAARVETWASGITLLQRLGGAERLAVVLGSAEHSPGVIQHLHALAGALVLRHGGSFH
jgi:hypothetical protein